ncbi:exosporium glycoprotein BclB-related protein [Dyadobacter aurulentus]|uniref:exosporium glycoprotein BclB-related protein n=1 Tax=Dyadobacter sp. UC 10 TaxID=2605428 RepID=UPI0011F0EF7D|nr:exosporium glycoprotein BclB-related protein [Dyadobacter sp. UC 10]KAA0992735.1 hypothetical protein FXO21_22445 [Dyadobacter sp. UC 10]
MVHKYTFKTFFGINSAITACILALFSLHAQAQVGVGTTSPHPTAQLEVQSTSKGVLIPRMLDTERAGISDPATGLLVYQTNGAAGFYYYTGSEWTPLKTEAPATGGTIIPFASGTPAVITTLGNGLAGTSTALGFGNSVTGVNVSGGLVDATMLNNVAFSVPRNGTITSLYAFFSNSLALALLGTDINLRAELYVAQPGSNSFTPIGPSAALSPSFSGIISIGSIAEGNLSGLNIPVTAGQRIMLVFSADANGISLVNTLAGFASAGININ